jgi:hypothetical protein
MNQYRTLDSQREGPDVTGPTRDHAADTAANPTYRQEWSYNIQPGRRPVTLTGRTRPQTTAAKTTTLTPGRMPVLVRNSNMNPAATGTGDSNSTWRVSDPYWSNTSEGAAAVAGLGDPPPLAQLGPSPFTKYFFGIAALTGIVGYFVWKKLK